MLKTLKKKIVWIPLLIIMASSMWFLISKTSKEKTIYVDGELIELRNIVQKINASGKIQPEEAVQITSTITGWITEITVM